MHDVCGVPTPPDADRHRGDAGPVAARPARVRKTLDAMTRVIEFDDLPGAFDGSEQGRVKARTLVRIAD